MRTEHVYHPDFLPEPYWSQSTPPEAGPTRDLPAAADVVVVGGGDAGLVAALELAAGDREVCVVNPGPLGAGTTAHMSDPIGVGGPLGGAGRGDDPALRHESARALAFVEGLIEHHAIDCAFERCGHFVGACAPRHLERLRAWAGEAPGEAEIVTRERQWEDTGSAYYHGGLRVRTAARLDPARYEHGLLEACRRRHVRLHAHAEVHAVAGRPGSWQVRTSRGEVRARDVILTTSGGSGPLASPVRERVIPVARHAIATEPVPPEIAQVLFPDARTLSETARLGHRGRLSPDGQRVLLEGYAGLRAIGPRAAALHLHRRLLERFPHLRGIRLTHAWSSTVAATRDGLPHAGRTDGLYYCAGSDAGGIGLLPYLGYVVARRLLSAPVESARWQRPFAPIPVPGYRARPWFLPLVGAYLTALDWHERRDPPH